MQIFIGQRNCSPPVPSLLMCCCCDRSIFEHFGSNIDELILFFISFDRYVSPLNFFNEDFETRILYVQTQ